MLIFKPFSRVCIALCISVALLASMLLAVSYKVHASGEQCNDGNGNPTNCPDACQTCSLYAGWGACAGCNSAASCGACNTGEWGIWCQGSCAQDTDPPFASITSPAYGTAVSGTNQPVHVSASDNVGIARVELLVDGVSISTLTVAPYTFNWNTTQTPNGSHQLSAKAVDTSGNQVSSGTNNPILVTVSNAVADTTPPTVSITSPVNGAVSDLVAVNINASDAQSGVANVELWIDNIRFGSDSAAPYSFSWNAAAEVNGSTHVLQAKAYNGANLQGSSGQVTVTISNPIGGGALTVTCPTLTTTIQGQTGSIVASVSAGTAPYTCIWSGVTGMSPNGCTGTIPATLAAGSYTAVVGVRDSSSPQKTGSANCPVQISISSGGQGGICNSDTDCTSNFRCNKNATGSGCSCTTANYPNIGNCAGSGTGSMCGNGIKEGLEQCDAGTANNGACPKTCSATCSVNSCGATYAQLTINNQPAGTFIAGQGWRLDLTGAPASAALTICAKFNQGAQSCTPLTNLSQCSQKTVNAVGTWMCQGTFSVSDIGSWEEWMLAGTMKSSQVTFTVGSGTVATCSSASCSTCSQAQCTTTTGCQWSGSACVTSGGSTQPPPPPPGFRENTCTNPSPALTAYALPCPVLNVSPKTLSRTEQVAVLVTKGATSYIYRTIYISEGSTWKPYVDGLQPVSQYPGWAVADASFANTAQALNLSLGKHYVAEWDWTYDASRSTATSPCWLGPGSTTCNTGGKWRVQEFTVL